MLCFVRVAAGVPWLFCACVELVFEVREPGFVCVSRCSLGRFVTANECLQQSGCVFWWACNGISVGSTVALFGSGVGD